MWGSDVVCLQVCGGEYVLTLGLLKSVGVWESDVERHYVYDDAAA